MNKEDLFCEAARCHVYDKQSGKVYRVVRNNRVCSPSLVLTEDKHGYLLMTCFYKGKQYNLYVHRFVWFLHHGLPAKGFEIDHINGDKKDNRIENLRIATRTQNRHNSKAKGCYRAGGGWVAEITTFGIRKYLGFFRTEQDAKKAYFAAVENERGEFVSYVSTKM